jgi:hypothetical protein
MKKALDFRTYKQFQKLSFNDTNRLLSAFYANAYDDGKHFVQQECIAALTEDHLLEILLSVKGIGRNRAEQVIAKIIEEGVTYGIETGRDHEADE